MITIKSPQEIDLMRQGGKILARILRETAQKAAPGVDVAQLEEYAKNEILKAGGLPSFQGYQGSKHEKPFPTCLCASINSEIVHSPALPHRVLHGGDVIGLDLGMKYPEQDGLFTDMALTVGAGKLTKQAEKLIKVTKKALEVMIKQIKPGRNLCEIGETVQKYVEKHGFNVIRDLVGHGVGYKVHEEPRVPNYPMSGSEKVVLEEGMTLALEPMVCTGDWHLKTLADGWTIVMADGGLGAHYEATIVVTRKGCEVLTL